MLSCGLLQSAHHSFLLCYNMRQSTDYYSLYAMDTDRCQTRGSKSTYYVKQKILYSIHFFLCKIEYKSKAIPVTCRAGL
jgi:hypothetical protein